MMGYDFGPWLFDFSGALDRARDIGSPWRREDVLA